jgi:cathepsin A (carboxypeptidase C)
VENGPCSVNDHSNGTIFNPYSWTESYHVIFVDQPVGTGFSYVDDVNDTDSYHRRTEDSALDFVSLVKLLQEAFPLTRSLPLHVAGESYAGRFIPVYAATIIDFNNLVDPSSRIPLASIMVGNGWSSPLDTETSLYAVSCHVYDSIAPIYNATECAAMAAATDQCELMMEGCVAVPDELICTNAGKYCDEHLLYSIKDKYLTPYDRTLTCPEPGDCYPDMQRAVAWLNSTKVMHDELEIPQASGGRKTEFVMSSEIVSKRFHESGDFWMSSLPALKKVLDYSASEKMKEDGMGIEVLYYTGTNDWICNQVGVRRYLESVRWKSHAEFRAMRMDNFSWGEKGTEGRSKKVEGLWYFEILDAGHLVSFLFKRCI